MRRCRLPFNVLCPDTLGKPFPEAGMITDVDKLVLLHLVGRTKGDIVEVGVNQGKTTRMLATHFPDRTIHAIDFSAGSTLCPPQRHELPKVACEAALHLPNVRLHDANSQTLDYRTIGDNIGFVFIDADHTYEGVKADTERAFEYMRGRVGIVAWHDYSPDIEPYIGVVRFLDELDRHLTYRMSHYPGSRIAFTAASEWGS